MFDCAIYLGCRPFDGKAYIGTPSGVNRCRTVRQFSTEFVLSIKATPWSPDGERAGDVNIRVDLLDQSIPRLERFGLTARSLGCRAIRTRIGCPASHPEEGLSKNSRGSFQGRWRQREPSEPGTRSYPETRDSRTLINGQIARSGKELVLHALVMVLETRRHHAQLNRVPVLTSLRENRSMMRTLAILRMTRGDPESRLRRKEKQRESGSTSSMVKKAMYGRRAKKNGCESTVFTNEICSLRTTLRADLS